MFRILLTDFAEIHIHPYSKNPFDVQITLLFISKSIVLRTRPRKKKIRILRIECTSIMRKTLSSNIYLKIENIISENSTSIYIYCLLFRVCTMLMSGAGNLQI